jgi:hypothetical protein
LCSSVDTERALGSVEGTTNTRMRFIWFIQLWRQTSYATADHFLFMCHFGVRDRFTNSWVII